MQNISTKSWVYQLEIWSQNMRICFVLLQFFKKFRNLIPPKNHKIIIEKKVFIQLVFGLPELFRVINYH